MNVHCSSPEGIFLSTDPRADRWKGYLSSVILYVYLARHLARRHGGLAKTRHRRLFAFELRRWGYAARERWSIVAMARIAAIFCRSRDDPAAANPAKPLLTLRSHAVRSPWPCPVCRNTRQKGDVGSRGAGSSGPARHARRWMGG